MKNNIDLNIENHELKENTMTRRNFVKKALYKAPTLVMLGSLPQTTFAGVGDSTGTGFGGVGGGNAPAQTGGNSSGLNSGFGAN